MTSFLCRIYVSQEPAHDHVKHGSYVPAVYEVFLERVAYAAHARAHFYETCEFDFSLFNAKMAASLSETKKVLADGKGSSNIDGRRGHKEKKEKNVDTEAATPGNGKPTPSTSACPDREAIAVPPGRANARDQVDDPADETAAALCSVVGWKKLNCDAFLRRARTAFGFRKDPMQENPDLQAELEALHDNTRNGRLDAAKENVRYLQAIIP